MMAHALIALLIAGSFFVGYAAGWGDHKSYKETKETYGLIEDCPTYIIDKE